MNKNYLIIGGIALVGAGAYLLYKKEKEKNISDKDILEKQLEEEKANALKIIADNKKKASISLQNPNSKKAKIAVIQRSIGVASDGILGPQTLGKLKELFPSLVTLTDANLDKIYTFVQNNPYSLPSATTVTLDYGQKPLLSFGSNPINNFTNTFKPFN